MISHKYKCIFIHIPKTAGTSLEKKLGLFEHLKRNIQDHRSIKHIQPFPSKDFFNLFFRQNEGIARKRLLKYLLTPNGWITHRQYRTYFKFTIVRNPWHRVYSWYKGVMRDPYYGIPKCDFATFLTHYADHWGLKPQTFWIKDAKGNIPFHRIIKFENLSQNIPEVLKKLGFPDTTLPHLLKGNPADDAGSDDRYIFNGTTISLIAERYREEIELFGYRFSP